MAENVQNKELHSDRPFSGGAMLWGGMAALLLVGGWVHGNIHLMIFALAPGMLAIGLLLGRPQAFHAVLTEDGLEVHRPPRNISYSKIEGMTINGFGDDPNKARLKSGPLVVTHCDGVIEIPAALNAPVLDVYRTILALVPTTGCYELSHVFKEHYQKECAMFGAERVHSFTRRKIIGRRPSTRRGRLCAAMLFACGVLWCLVPALVAGRCNASSWDMDMWLGWGVVMAILSLFAWLVLYLQQQWGEANAKDFRDAELIVSPTGIAVKQGDLQGHVRWEELLDVQLTKRLRVFLDLTGESRGGIHLAFAGARIRLADVYDRPIALIYQQIRRYWKKT